MDKVITSAMLMIASVIAAVALMNAVLPAMGKSAGALTTANGVAADRIKTDIAIVHATGDDTNDKITVWVKNIGTQAIKPVTSSDVFLTSSSAVTRLPYVSGCTSECWDYCIESGGAGCIAGSGSDWIQAVTVKFTLKTTISTGTYNVSVSVLNAVEADKDFSV